MSKRDPIYKVIFLNQGQVYEMYAKQIYQSDLWGFLEVDPHRRGRASGHGEDQRSQGRRQRHAIPHADAGQISSES